MSAVQLDCHTCATCLILESQNLQDFKSRISGYQQCHPSTLVTPEDAKQNYPAKDGQIQFLYSCTLCDPYIKIRYLTIMLWLRRIDNLRFLYFGIPVHGGGAPQLGKLVKSMKMLPTTFAMVFTSIQLTNCQFEMPINRRLGENLTLPSAHVGILYYWCQIVRSWCQVAISCLKLPSVAKS